MNIAENVTRLVAEPDQIQAHFLNVFEKQKSASRTAAYPSLTARLQRLDKLEKMLKDNEQAIADAINQDFGNRAQQETQLAELYGLLSGIAYTKKRLKKWMKPQGRHVGLAFFGAQNRVIPQPKGVIGIVTPWNYPLFLSLSPCISAIAAGNRCIIKLAANSQTLAKLLADKISDAFDESELALIPGVSAGKFTDMPWDHLVFTGSPATAKTVMATAAKHLTPVTLELGGKSPTIIAPDFDVKKAAKRILFGKFLNAGQTCVAPDYLFVPEDKVAEFVEVSKKILKKRYQQLDSKDYTSIIDHKAFIRLQSSLDDAKQQGAQVVNLFEGEASSENHRKIAPHLVVDPSDDMQIMQEEIFGPLLPIKPYKELDTVLSYINEHERPLALYLYSDNKDTQNKVIYNTLSGGMCINDGVLHVAQHDMPFGGIGNSGTGHYHGKEGFIEFSKLRPIFKQAPVSGILALAPPYGKVFDKMYRLMVKLKL